LLSSVIIQSSQSWPYTVTFVTEFICQYS